MGHDYVVVGAGSSGCALAAGLASQGFSVLLLEAGPKDRDPRIRVPGTFPELWFGRLDWAYDTEPQPTLDGRRDTWPRGRVLGGSSSINAMMYVRGLPQDYDDWEAAGATGWNGASMLDTFSRLEDDQRGAAPHRGVGGPVRVEHQRDPRPLSVAFLDACEELGIPRVDDYHLDPFGCALVMATQRNGRRWSAADAFLRPHLRDRTSPLRVRAGAEVVRVVVERGRAVGVEVLAGGRLRLARAEREVILAAGTVASPHLLLRSGIGPADELRALGVDVVADAPGVGRDLQDHLVAGLAAATDGSDSLCGAERDPRHLVEWMRTRTGPATSVTMEAIAFARSSDDLDLPDLELAAVPMVVSDHARMKLPFHGITLGAVLLRPESRGYIRLASADPAVPPIVDPRSLTDPGGHDLRRLIAGVRRCQSLLLETRALGRRVERLAFPTEPMTTDDEVAAQIRTYAQTLYHPVGTCRMGSDDAAVVDPELRVRGIDGLRVADASVMPNLMRGHTHAAAMAVGERAARLIATGASAVAS